MEYDSDEEDERKPALKEQQEQQEQQEQDPKITKTVAKSDYFLKDEDLVGVPFTQYMSRRYKKYVTLYERKDIEQRAYAKWGGEVGFRAEKKHREQRRTKRRNNKITRMDARRNELANALAVHGLRIRSDSRLCDNYIEGTLRGWSLEEVVTMCCMMNWLHTCTDYATRLEEEIYNCRQALGYCNIEETADDLRSQIISEHGGGQPWSKV